MSTATLQSTLAAEHAAVHVYAALGGATSRSGPGRLSTALTEAHDDHRDRRDALVRLLAGEGAVPEAAAPAYEVPDLSSPRAVEAAALDVERACAAVYADLVAGTSGDRRRWAVGLLRSAALRQLTFGGRPEPFPGLDELG